MQPAIVYLLIVLFCYIFSTLRDYDNDANRPQLMSGRATGSKVFSDMGTTGWGDDSQLSSDTFDVTQAQRLTQQVIKGIGYLITYPLLS